MNIRYVISLIGKILFIEALLMLLPFLVAVIYGEETVLAYAASIAILLLVGGASFMFPPKSKLVRAREGLAVAGLSWIVVSLFGALPLWFSGDIPSYLDAVFEIVSGFTTTGASILTDVEALSYSGLFWRSFSHWVGGMGVLVFALAILPSTDTQSMHLMRAEVPGLSVGKLAAKMRWSASILYIIYMVMTVILFLFLAFGGMPIFDAMVNAFGTAGTGGFAVKSASIAGYGSVYAEVVITVFMLLFSLNFNIYFLLLAGSLKDLFKSEELHWFLGIVAASVAAIAINIFPLYRSIGQSLRYSSFQVASIISTSGFATADYELWPTFSKTILVILMFFGACCGSTGGGIKIARVVIICKTAAARVKKQLFPRAVVPTKFEGKLLDREIEGGVAAYMSAYLIILILSVLALSLDQFSLTTNFTAVAACLNNIGPGLETVGPSASFAPLSAFSKLVLIFDMLAGRLELFPILILFYPRTWKNS